MSKTKTSAEVREELTATDPPTVEQNDRWARENALTLALSHHKANGGMLTVTQLIDNAKQFHAYITGETK